STVLLKGIHLGVPEERSFQTGSHIWRMLHFNTVCWRSYSRWPISCLISASSTKQRLPLSIPCFRSLNLANRIFQRRDFNDLKYRTVVMSRSFVAAIFYQQ